MSFWGLCHPSPHQGLCPWTPLGETPCAPNLQILAMPLVMRCWCGYLSGARCILFSYGPTDASASQNRIVCCRRNAVFKSTLVLRFWHRLTQVVQEKRSLNGCSSNSSSISQVKHQSTCNIVMSEQTGSLTARSRCHDDW